jgi:sec-independent protein translocase protein TatA
MSVGIWQVVLILLIVLIIFGAGKLPQVMGDVAKGIKSFKSGMKEDEQQEPRTIAADRTERVEPTAADRDGPAAKG